MPELPEVQGYKVYIDSTSLHKKIMGFECRDARLLKKPKADFEQHLLKQELTETLRIGKYLFLKTTGDKILVIHFGMTGRPNYYKDEEDRPKFGHIVLTFENGFHFAFENKRKFGWWNLIDSIEDYKSEHKLSDDARDLSLEDFKASLSSRKTHIKKVIMDQSVAAGVGNWMADDILYQAKIHPKKKVQDMTVKAIEQVFDAMKNVIEVAIAHDAHYSDFPKHFLIHFRKEGATCFHTGGKIEKIKLGGRSTYFSPELQQL
ncbi:DNA-formamidopyrimidine glycosylase [Subsaximicrobium wynnwilliamsii]|uniref:DNA-formamidopyrimidine glycosylase n=1 Tax=Subsaximicrobium wynnwilliamsii TaxID=291179 RepID=A0A5C6ZLY6_9FLAO|nr:DNA-formamidopyrimidine glycosylase family protein [Subsaximicrobium wynnwilliamsii]TXD85552.1 DNA-formamidopyrimidine glycosylase [Subsaximicrobium wynnwilliamsii]TXD90905.1 DNA-formamidopyrimidine glycosylase [Subsaximicrobium wynnwilliamsii]TXE05412.1 DNA-formamidopyrimidine glycosylase [Subsaximicrobium wynnwilliamsii]